MMARKLDAMPPAGMGTRGIYPWEEWFDGDVWELVQGEDFQPAPFNMYKMIRARAKEHGIDVTARTRGSRVYVQAHLNGQAT